jgi:hypothetical protein
MPLFNLCRKLRLQNFQKSTEEEVLELADVWIVGNLNKGKREDYKEDYKIEQDEIGGNGIDLARRLAAERADTGVPVGEGEGLKEILTFAAGKVEAHLSSVP